MRYGSYNARSFNIPFHDYDNYSSTVVACQSGVADAFFQTFSDSVNDFPYLTKGSGNSGWRVADGSATNSAGCNLFVEQQERSRLQLLFTGYYLDEQGVLRHRGSGSLDSRFTTGRSAADLSYVYWGSKGNEFSWVGSYGETTDSNGGSNYLARVDGLSIKPRAISPATATWSVPPNTSNGKFGASWHGVRRSWTERVVTTIPGSGYYTPCSGEVRGNVCYGTRTWVWTTPPSTVVSYVTRYADAWRVTNSGSAYHLTKAKSDTLCPSGYHPRGEDAQSRIGSHTGRTLSGMSQTTAKIADRFWCRSDVRYKRIFKPQIHSGVTQYSGAPRTGVFTAYGRLGCYYTTTGNTTLANGGTKCGYRFPLPRCDSDNDGVADRDYTADEIAVLIARTGNGVTLGQQFTIDETADCSSTAPPTPPSQAGFRDVACVTADLEISENRVATSDAEPGVIENDRTLTVAAGTREAYDLDITSPHPKTASPPRNATASTEDPVVDPSGCASGPESRADHAANPADTARKQSSAPSYATSLKGNTAHPPSVSGDSSVLADYSGARLNLAHRYASKIAENTCAAKEAEAKAELALLEEREAAFTRWLADYKTAADQNSRAFGSFARTPKDSGAGLGVSRLNDFEEEKHDYARDPTTGMSAKYASLSTALASAKRDYDNVTDRADGASRAAVIVNNNLGGCVSYYNGEITRLKTLFAGAETTAKDTIGAAETAISSTVAPTPGRVSLSTVYTSTSRPDIRARLSRTTSSCGGISFGGSCWGQVTPPPGCEGFMCGIGRIGFTYTYYYTCPGGSYEVSGTVSGTYAGPPTQTRSRGFSASYVAASRGESTSRRCPSFVVGAGATYESEARTYVYGLPNRLSTLPRIRTVAAPAALSTLNKNTILGNYSTTHPNRINLTASSADDRNTAASLTLNPGTTTNNAAVNTWQTTYTTAYDTAYTQAIGHMGGTSSAVWSSFDWRYETSTLDWGGYLEDPGTTFSASTSTPKDGTGCDLVNVAADGEVTVQATRLDHETSSYGLGATYGTRTDDSQRTCKVRRTRTPELLLMYAPAVRTGVDTCLLYTSPSPRD